MSAADVLGLLGLTALVIVVLAGTFLLPPEHWENRAAVARWLLRMATRLDPHWAKRGQPGDAWTTHPPAEAHFYLEINQLPRDPEKLMLGFLRCGSPGTAQFKIEGEVTDTRVMETDDIIEFNVWRAGKVPTILERDV